MTTVKRIELNKEELPEGWAAATLAGVASYIQRGKSPKYTDHSELPVVNQKCVRWHGIDREFVKYIHPDQFEKWEEKRFLQNGDLLWNSTGTGTIGRAAIVQLRDGERFVADSHVTIVRSAEGMEPKYVHYWVMGPAVQNSIEAMQSGSTNQVELSKGAVETTPIPVAPPEQQKRIVAKIEELFSHIDAGVESLNKAKQLLRQYRQSVLKAAVTGELLGSAFPEDIFKSIDFGLETLGQGWSPRCEKEPSPDESTWGVIKTTAVQSLEYRQNENKRLPDALDPRPKHEVLVGDLLVTRAGPRVRVGICCLVKETRQKLMICDKVYRLRVKKDVILPEYLELVLNAPNVLSEIEKLKSGINDSGVNLTQNKFVQLQIPYPSLGQQGKLVLMVGEKVESIARLGEEIERQLLKAEKNKQSILASAFGGSLS